MLWKPKPKKANLFEEEVAKPIRKTIEAIRKLANHGYKIKEEQVDFVTGWIRDCEEGKINFSAPPFTKKTEKLVTNVIMMRAINPHEIKAFTDQAKKPMKRSEPSYHTTIILVTEPFG
jgi:hypothetical protein